MRVYGEAGGLSKLAKKKGYASFHSGLKLANAATEGDLNDPSSGQALPLNFTQIPALWERGFLPHGHRLKSPVLRCFQVQPHGRYGVCGSCSVFAMDYPLPGLNQPL